MRSPILSGVVDRVPPWFPATSGGSAALVGAAGLITRRRDNLDNRLVRLWLTDEGRTLQEPIEAERRLIEEEVTENERKRLLNALTKIYHSASDLLGVPIDDNDPAIS